MNESNQLASGSMITVALAWSANGVAQEIILRVATGTTIGALTTSAELASQVPASVTNAPVGIGVWGKLRPKTYKLRQGDRVELYLPLRVDPKEQRRQRAR